MVRYWAHNPGTDNACASSTLAPATNTSGCSSIWQNGRFGSEWLQVQFLSSRLHLMGGLSNWLARRPVKPLPAGHVGSSPTPPIDTNFTFPGNSVGLECHLYTLEVGGSNPSSGTTFERMVAQRQRQWSQEPSSVSSNLTHPISCYGGLPLMVRARS